MTELPPAVPPDQSIDVLPPNPDLTRADFKQDIGLKKTYAISLLVGLGAQLVIADVVFVLYAALGVHWKISASVMDVWIGATVVEVIAVVLVVTTYLFPNRDAQHGG
jgi:hypothetical protein